MSKSGPMAGYRTDVRLQARSVRPTATYKAMRWRMKWRLSAGYAQIGKESTMKPAKKVTQKSPSSTAATRKNPEGLTDQERVAMRERLQELKADARRGRRADKADGESAVLAQIAALLQPDRGMGERLHAII